MITALGRNLSHLCLKYSSKSNVVLSLPLHQRFSTSLGLEPPSLSSPTVHEFLVHKHHFSPESASQIASVLSCFRNPEKSDPIPSFPEESYFSTSQLEIMAKSKPEILSALDKIKPKFKVFHDLGISCSDVAQIIMTDPAILEGSLNNRFILNLSLLKRLLGSNDELVRFLMVARWFLKLNLGNSLVPNVELLYKCGVSMDQILQVMRRFPRLLLGKQDDMKKFVDTADAMGVSRNSKLFIHAVRVIASMSDETMELKLRTFREAGFSDDDTAAMFKKQPLVFGLSREKIKETKELLLANGKYNLSNISSYPTALRYSIEKRYKPRFQVLELLEGKNLIQRWPKLSIVCTMTDKTFFQKYVAPFEDEIGGLYMAKSTTYTK